MSRIELIKGSDLKLKLKKKGILQQDIVKKFGYNELPSAKPKNLLRIALEVIKEPMFLLLLAFFYFL